MRKITIETRVPLGNGVCEIKERTFAIPENIVYKGKYLSYNSYLARYEDISSEVSISGKDYVLLTLSEADKKRKAIKDNEN